LDSTEHSGQPPRQTYKPTLILILQESYVLKQGFVEVPL
jgi:hypothetical protein